ncbi:TTF-type domain-containing protein [Trichonephila clavipes]|nr:TTF-type domain-containing protein [Trichonephila clavipes]
MNRDASDEVKQVYFPVLTRDCVRFSRQMFNGHDIVQSGATQQLNSSDKYYPKDDDHRHFSNFHFSSKLNNGETQHRRCLVYSSSKNKTLCLSCRLLSNSQTQMFSRGLPQTGKPVKGSMKQKSLGTSALAQEESDTVDVETNEDEGNNNESSKGQMLTRFLR